MLFCPPTSHTVRDVFLSRSRFPTLKPMVGDVSITLRWRSTTWLKSPLSPEKCISYEEAHLSRQQLGQQSGLSSRVQTHQDHLNTQLLMFSFYSLFQGTELRVLYILCVMLEYSQILKRKLRILGCLIYLRRCGATSLAHLATRRFSFSNLFLFSSTRLPPLFVFSTCLSSLPSCSPGA